MRSVVTQNRVSSPVWQIVANDNDVLEDQESCSPRTHPKPLSWKERGFPVREAFLYDELRSWNAEILMTFLFFLPLPFPREGGRGDEFVATANADVTTDDNGIPHNE